eukprot:1192903-Rhodomonas_salina.3
MLLPDRLCGADSEHTLCRYRTSHTTVRCSTQREACCSRRGRGSDLEGRIEGQPRRRGSRRIRWAVPTAPTNARDLDAKSAKNTKFSNRIARLLGIRPGSQV